MTYSIEYFHAKVQATVEAWPVDVVADYARIVELLIEYGPNLRLPHSRAFGGGLFEPTNPPTAFFRLNYVRAANRALEERSTVFLSGSA